MSGIRRRFAPWPPSVMLREAKPSPPSFCAERSEVAESQAESSQRVLPNPGQEPAPQEFAKAKIRCRRAPGRSIEANIGEYATKSSGRGRG